MYLGQNTEFLAASFFFRYRWTELDRSSERVIFCWNPVCNIEFERKASNWNVFAAMWADIDHSEWSEPLIWFLQTRILRPVPRMVERSQGRDCCTVCFRPTNFYLENRGRLVLKNTFLFCKWEEIVNRYQLTHLIRVNCECDTDTASRALPFNLLSWK